MSTAIDTLTSINLEDLVEAFGWQRRPLPSAVLRRLFVRPAREFARQMLDYDQLVGDLGLHEASRTILQNRYIRDLRIHSPKYIPIGGPALFLSNHPGMSDTVSLFAAIPRDDLRIIALHRPFLATLSNITPYLVYISEDPGERMRAVRQVSAHLRAGGAALTFPAGRIEPDPDLHPDAVDSLREWNDSSAIFLRFSPDMQIVPVLVSGVIWERTVRHWLARIKRTREEREKLAAALQLLAVITRDPRPTTVHVRFGKPITRDEAGSIDPACIHGMLIDRMRRLIRDTNRGDGVSAF